MTAPMHQLSTTLTASVSLELKIKHSAIFKRSPTSLKTQGSLYVWTPRQLSTCHDVSKCVFRQNDK